MFSAWFSISLKLLRIFLIKLLPYSDTIVDIKPVDDCNDLLAAFILFKSIPQIYYCSKFEFIQLMKPFLLEQLAFQFHLWILCLLLFQRQRNSFLRHLPRKMEQTRLVFYKGFAISIVIIGIYSFSWSSKSKPVDLIISCSVCQYLCSSLFLRRALGTCLLCA